MRNRYAQKKMTLRRSLVPKKQTFFERKELLILISEIEKLLLGNENAESKIKEFNHKTGFDYDAEFFSNFRSSMSLDELLDQIFNPTPKKVSDITREELVEIISRAMPDNPNFDRKNESYYRELFEANVPLPNASDLIYWPPKNSGLKPKDWKPTPERIVDIALAHKPILI